MASVEAPVRKPARRQARPKAVPHPTATERAATGKAARAIAPRAAHGEWEPAADRPDPVELLEEQAASRVQELVPIRYGRMLVSPFTFFRGAAYPMAADLAGAPRTGLDVQLCGDAHLSNFGAFGAPDRRLVFSINDFDETLPGPFEWDVKRLVASFAVAGRDRGFDAKQRRVDQPDGHARVPGGDPGASPGCRNLDLWYSRIDVDEIAAFAAQRASGEAAQAVRAQRGQGAVEGQHEGLHEAHGDRRRQAAGSPATRRSSSRSRTWRPASSRLELEEFLRGVIRSYRRTLSPDRRRLLERYPVHARGAQGRRRGQRRRARLDRAHARPRRDRSAVPAAQGGAGVGARAVPGQEHVQPSRPARRRGPATDAGGQRHHARLDPAQRRRTA